jgi:hypothetical protein
MSTQLSMSHSIEDETGKSYDRGASLRGSCVSIISLFSC